MNLEQSKLALEPFSLQADDPPSVLIVNATGTSKYVLTCDHASNNCPKCVPTLGLSDADMQSHIAWDPGALDVALELSRLLNATLIHSSYSRLLVDLNRPPSSDGHIAKASAGIRVPANASISSAEVDARRAALFTPYHNTISGVLDAKERRSRDISLVAIHSFTPDYPGEHRPWHIGLTYRKDGGLGSHIVRELRKACSYTIGDNQPYQINDTDDVTIPLHGERRGLPNALIEIRQDLLQHSSGTSAVAKLLASVLDIEIRR